MSSEAELERETERRMRDIIGLPVEVRRHDINHLGPLYEIGYYVEGTTAFIPVTPLWSDDTAAWNDALERYTQRKN
jgi:hypothetical protein